MIDGLVVIHGQVVARGEAETIALAVRRACEEALRKAKDEGMVDAVCTCPKKRRGRETKQDIAGLRGL